MTKEFTVDGEAGTLQPLRSGLFIRFPPWVPLTLSLPFLLSFLAALLYGNLIFQLFFGAASFLFLISWYWSRKLAKDAGKIRIFKESGEASIVQRDGTEKVIRLGGFRRITIAKVVVLQDYTGGAFLEGEAAELLLCGGLTLRGRLIRRVSPVAEWLRIPIEISERCKTVDLATSVQENNTVFHK
jgi:hypothetical protein